MQEPDDIPSFRPSTRYEILRKQLRVPSELKHHPILVLQTHKLDGSNNRYKSTERRILSLSSPDKEAIIANIDHCLLPLVRKFNNSVQAENVYAYYQAGLNRAGMPLSGSREEAEFHFTTRNYRRELGALHNLLREEGAYGFKLPSPEND